MGEIDTKSIESVQAALSLFGEKTDQRKHRPSSSDQEMEKEKELEGVLKDLANCKVQLEVKESAYMQTLLKLELYQKTADELSTLLKDLEAERERYIDECREARRRIDVLESKMKEMSAELSETVKTREQLSHVIRELKATQGELLSLEMELAAARESKLEAMAQAVLMETAANIEKEKADELLRHVSELNEAILHLELDANEAENEKCALLSEKEAEIQLATATAVEAQEQLDDMRKQIEVMQDLENELLAKSVFIDSLQLEIKQANEVHSSSAKAASDAINGLNQLKSDLELEEKKNLDQAVLIKSLEMELNQLKLELKNANEEVGSLNCGVEMLIGELQKAKDKIDEIGGRETEAQVEIALLKSELHKGRSKIAAAEAAEARAESVKSGLYLAVQELAVEAEEAKKENRRLKHGAGQVAEETGDTVLVTPESEKSSQDEELSQIDELKTEVKDRRDNIDAHIIISRKEYESLIWKAEKADQVPVSLPEYSSQLTTSDNRYELEILKKELEVAMVKIGEFRTRAEQAVSRAEMAEKAKSLIEAELRRWRQQRQRRKAALDALWEDAAPKESNPPQYVNIPATLMPLGKVLNMKF